MKSWYSISNKAGGDALDISLHDEIGMWGISASEFISDIKAHGNASQINLSIHSPGGNALDGLAMYNALVSHPAKVHTHVAGLAASAASIVLMAGDEITMPEDAFIMIHNPFTLAIGGGDEMRAVADTLDKIQASLVNIYAKRTGKDAAEVSQLMDDETWLNAADASDHGFIDSVTDKVNIAAKAGAFSKYFKTMPVSNNYSDVNELETVKDYERYLRDSGGVSKGLATALTSRAKAIFQGDPDESLSDNEVQQLTNAFNRIQQLMQ